MTGLSHFLEHMMFKGTDRYGKGEIDYITTRNGGSNNAFTTHDYTTYYFSFASDRWWTALEIEADRMSNNRLDPEEFELERRVIIEELKMQLDTPWEALRLAVEKESFERHPYRFPVIGFSEDVLALSLEQMLEHYQFFYVPNNAILVVVGDFAKAKVLERVEELFGPLPRGKIPEVVTPVEPSRVRQMRLEVRKPTQVPRMLFAFRAPSVRDSGHYAMQILDKVLSGGKLSRLYRRLIEKERVASLAISLFDLTFDPHLFSVHLELQDGIDLAKVERMVFEEVDELCRFTIPENELQRAKNQCITECLGDFETGMDQAIQLGLLETLDCFEYWQNYAERIQRLTAEEVKRTASRYWSCQQATVGILLDDKR